MFGNMQGWIASVVIIALTAGLIVWKGKPEGRSKPTGSLKAAMVSAAVQPSPDTLIPKGTKDANAGEVYRMLAAAVKGKSRVYDLKDGDFVRAQGTKKRAMIKTVEAEMDMLIEAGECAKMDLFASKPTEVINYANRKPILPELQQTALVALSVAGMWATPDSSKPNSKPENPAKAQKLFEAIFHLGRFLSDERVFFEEYRIGVDLMGNAAKQLSKRGNYDAAKKDQLDLFSQQISLERYLTAIQVITGIPEEGKLMALPGDIFDVALNSKEPMWQVEAILKLGRMRYMQGVKYGDQRDASLVLAELAARTDLPANVKAAAVAARDMTIEQVRMIGGSA
ncbi:hypothetical protein [Humisphaera borealis]|uniref:Uncharacterized protein n=1 Tax=Humisphaera borealis TaxID=2807512 RepID=A0A7M2X3Y8_9BACT|nr:hypothetical protein [Humisphaera borealis]QOV92162.1 hypothetical protein IPV69_12720 [Humisphaera borealis]